MMQMIAKLLKLVGRAIRDNTPFLREFLSAKRESKWSALKEVFLGLLFATIPIWLLPSILLIALLNAPSAQEQINSSINRGDLFLYAAALMGPLIYAITKRYLIIDTDEESRKRNIFRRMRLEFPYGGFFFSSAIVVCLSCALFYTLIVLDLESMGDLKLNISGLYWFSIAIFVYSVLCLLLVSVYRAEMEDVSAGLPAEERQFLHDWFNR